jgi:hypothetical protein
MHNYTCEYAQAVISFRFVSVSCGFRISSGTILLAVYAFSLSFSGQKAV